MFYVSQDLAKEITLMEQRKSHERRNCYKTSTTYPSTTYPSTTRQSSLIDVKSKARSIAQSTFELSDIEVDDFMSAGNGDSGLVSLDMDQTVSINSIHVHVLYIAILGTFTGW